MNRSVWVVLGVLGVLLLAVQANGQMMAPSAPGMMGSGGSAPMMGGSMMGGPGAMGGTQQNSYDLPKAKRLMSEARDLIEEGKAQYAAGSFQEARRRFKEAKEKLDEVRGTDQQQGGMGGGPGGPSMMGSGGPGAAPMMGAMSGSPMGSSGPGGPSAMGGAGGGVSTGIIPPDKVELVIEARMLWITAVMWWGKAWAGIASKDLIPQRVLLGAWTASSGEGGGGMMGSGGSSSGGSKGGPPSMGSPGGGKGK